MGGRRSRLGSPQADTPAHQPVDNQQEDTLERQQAGNQQEDIPPEELRLYYDDFEPLRPRCRFSGCTHTEEPDCAVRAEVGKSVGAGRYQRYLAIYGELLMRRKTKYD